MRYGVSFDNKSTGAVADTFKTMAALVAGDTAGYRARLRSLQIGPAEDAPVDLNAAVQIQRVDDVSAGSAGTGSSVTPTPKDSLSRAAIISVTIDHSAEPGTLGDPLWQMDFNCRAGFIKEWDKENAPVLNRDQLMAILMAPRTGVARTFSGSAEFEEF